MSGTWPTIPGMTMEIIRTVEWSTTIKRSASGRETRIQWWPAPLYNYQITIEFLRQGTVNPHHAAYSEAQTLVGFFNTNMGAWDTFTFTDPLDGIQRTVRFSEDTLAITRRFSNIWDIVDTPITLQEVRA